jgi:glyoxylase-like metal-dependent hydrolase (beta-lactamase superfamily II)
MWSCWRALFAWPYFGFAGEPDSVAEVDLGGRVLDCLATPGHHQAAVTYYDRYSGILLTGDTVHPGRLYVFDWTAFALDRPARRLVRAAAGDIPDRLPYRDDHHARS